MALVDDLKELRDRISKLREKKAKLEAQKDVLLTSVAEKKKELKALGFSTNLKEAKSQLSDLNDKVAQDVKRLASEITRLEDLVPEV